MIFYSKLIVKNPLTVIFVINSQNVSFTYFVNVTLSCRPIWVELFKINIKDKHDIDFTTLNFDKIFEKKISEWKNKNDSVLLQFWQHLHVG